MEFVQQVCQLPWALLLASLYRTLSSKIKLVLTFIQCLHIHTIFLIVQVFAEVWASDSLPWLQCPSGFLPNNEYETQRNM